MTIRILAFEQRQVVAELVAKTQKCFSISREGCADVLSIEFNAASVFVDGASVPSR